MSLIRRSGRLATRAVAGLAVGVALCAAALVSAPGTATAGDVGGAVAELDAAVAARLSAIGDDPGTPELRKERSRLTKGRRALSRLSGTADERTAPRIVAAIKAVAKAESSDPGVVAEMADLAAETATCVSDVISAAVIRSLQIYDPSEYLRVGRPLGIAFDSAIDARTTADTDLTEALLKIVRSANTMVSSGKRLEKSLAQQSGDLPALGTPFSIQNPDGTPFTIKSVEFEVFAYPPGMSLPDESFIVSANFKEYQDNMSDFVLPFRMTDATSEFDLYPTLLAAIAGEGGSTVSGTVIYGVMRFESSRHGKVLVPVDLVIP